MRLAAASVCALAGAAVFQFFGNANRGYIDTASLFYWWGFQWVNEASEAQHGWIVLALAAVMAWGNLRSAERGTRSAEWGSGRVWPAVVAFLAGLALHAVGFVAQQARLSILALLVFAWGVARLGGGRRWGAALLFPLAFLVFAIPLNAVEASFPLRMWVVQASAALARAAGIGVLQNGSQLIAPDGRYHYDVVEACSGVRSLTMMIALSLFAGYRAFRSWRRRAAILLLALPLIYAANVARILAIIFAAQLGGEAWGTRMHDVMGVGVFVIVLGGVLVVIRAWQRRRPEPDAPARDPRLSNDEPLCHLIGDKGVWAVAGAVMVIAAGEMAGLHHLAMLPPRGEAGVLLAADGVNPVELPAFIGTEWGGRRAEVTAVERAILPPDTGYSRKVYVSLGEPAPPVFVSIVLSGRDRSSIHRPELCLVGQGWSIAGGQTHRFARPGADAFPATVLRVQRERATPRGREAVPELVAYWFANGETVLANHWQRLALDAWNRVVHRRVDRWAYVLVQTDAADGEAAALRRIEAVLAGTLPVFQRGPAAR